MKIPKELNPFLFSQPSANHPTTVFIMALTRLALNRYASVIHSQARVLAPMASLSSSLHSDATSESKQHSGITQVKRRTALNTIVKFVPHQEAWVIERFGKFNRILDPGLNVLVPFIEKIKYIQSLKELALEICPQSAVTQDNVILHIDGVLYFRVVNPYKASYGVEDAHYAVTQLAQTTMRSEIGKMNLDQTFKERQHLNVAIVEAMNEAVPKWGIECLRYEIRDIVMPEEIVKAMQMQSSAERRKRANILDSEGTRQSEVNIAEGKKQATVLASEADMMQQINHARGEAEAITAKAEASALAVERIAKAINSAGGMDAASLRVAEKYVAAFEKLAKESTTILLPSNTNDPSAMVAQAMTIFKGVSQKPQKPLSSNDVPVAPWARDL